MVEDNEQIRSLVFSILKQFGCTPVVAENGGEALSILKQHTGPLHLLLTDVVMPGMNGKQLFIQASKKYPDLKVIYMSGYTEDVIAHRGVLEEDTAFIQKPFTVSELIDKILEVLQ